MVDKVLPNYRGHLIISHVLRTGLEPAEWPLRRLEHGRYEHAVDGAHGVRALLQVGHVQEVAASSESVVHENASGLRLVTGDDSPRQQHAAKQETSATKTGR